MFFFLSDGGGDDCKEDGKEDLVPSTVLPPRISNHLGRAFACGLGRFDNRTP